jgi:poly-beta-hydroxyalkanoate depolymerase
VAGGNSPHRHHDGEGEKGDIRGIAGPWWHSISAAACRWPCNATLATGTGLYGVFSGRRFARAVHPRAREMIQAHEGQDA